MAGAGYKLFNTGDVLTAAQVNTYLQEQTVMVFANSTARTTALSGVLAEGMVSYLQDTNAVEVYNGSAWVGVSGAGDVTEVQAGTGISVASGTGPIPVVTNTMATEITAKGDLIVGTGSGTFDNLPVGTNGYTLVADSSTATGLAYAAPAAGGAFTLLSTTTLSGASVTVSGISGAYQDLYIYLDRFYPATNDRTIRMRLNGDTGSNYRFQTHTDAGTATSSETSFGIAFDVANTRDEQNAGFYWLYNYSNATTYKSLQQHARYAGQATASTYGWSMYQGQYASTSAITSVTFFPVSGNWGGGTIYIYGVK